MSGEQEDNRAKVSPGSVERKQPDIMTLATSVDDKSCWNLDKGPEPVLCRNFKKRVLPTLIEVIGQAAPQNKSHHTPCCVAS